MLDAADLARIDAARATLTPIAGDCGDEYRRPPFLTASGDLSHHVASIPPVYTAVDAGGDGGCVVGSGTTWERLAAYSRAVRLPGGRVLVSGTTATGADGTCVGGADPAAQTHFALDKIEGAVRAAGCRSGLADVVRTRVYVATQDVWEPVARALGKRFGGFKRWPANTLVVAGLIGEGYLVEIEAEAVASE